MTAFTYPLLTNINYPNELRQLDASLLPTLAQEIRHYLIETLNRCGGHFAGNLGTVELTLALHYSYETPHDRLVWDIGHQTYPHKILTGRREQLHTIRQTHGLAPFLRRDESDYDHFGAGHSSTSISAALGMALAAQQQGIDRQCVAIIGDGAMSAGMVFEALNHAGALHANLLVILNDNDMSISPPVGALSNYFARTLSSKLYTGFRKGSKKILQRVPPMLEFAKRTEEHIKGMVAPGTLFEELGFNYLGPFDGHDIAELLRVLRNVKILDGPQFLHIVTKKGKGYSPAEMDPECYHAVKPGFYDRDQMKKKNPVISSKQPTYSNIFGQCLCDMASIEPKLVAITPAMLGGSDLIEFSKRFPERCFDVGIAEQHALTLAAGMAGDGLKPVVAIYSTFLQRAYDQLIHDIVIQNLPVVFAIDRAGIVGGDGVTHHGAYDLAFLRCLPNLIIMAPANENETRQMLYTAMQQSCPIAIRYPRGTGPGVPVQSDFSAYAIGKANIERQGEKIALLAFGAMLAPTLTIANELNATVVNMRFVKPLDAELINTIAQQHSLIVTLEEGVIQGGAGSAINEYLATQQIRIPMLNLGLPDTLIQHGDPKTLLAEAGLDTQGILQSIQHYQANN